MVYACRSAYTAEVIEIIGRCGDTIELMIDNLPPLTAVDSTIPVLDLDELRRHPIEVRTRATVVPLTTPGFRFKAVSEARAVGFERFPPLVDTASVVAVSADLDAGVVVNAGVVIGANTRLAEFVHVNRSASVGHDNVIGSFANLGPGCLLAGSVTVHRGAFLGAGAVCAPGITVGANAVVGAGAVVVRDVAAGTTVVGNPARVIREDGIGHGGVAVPES